MAHLLRAEALPDAFREVLLRLPSRRPQKGRQALRDVAGAESWAGADDDYERALAWTPSAFTWVRDRSHLVEVPALWCRVPLRDRDAGELSDLVVEALVAEGCPAPQLVVEGEKCIVTIWAIEPLRRPKQSAPENHHFTFRRCIEDWKKAAIKLSFALEHLGAIPLDAATADELLHGFVPFPLRRTSPLRSLVGLDEDPPGLVAAPAELQPLRIADVSRPLGKHDSRMFAVLGIGRPNSKRHWLRSARSLAAFEVTKSGERHPAAVDIACGCVWDGLDYDATVGVLRQWAAKCEQDGRFPFRRRKGDELELLAAWAISRLKPGGPDRPKARTNVNRTTRDGVAGAVVGFLRSNGGVWAGSKHELGKQSALWALAAGHPALCPRSTLRRALLDLKASGALLHEVQRVGATWSSTWRLPESGDHLDTNSKNSLIEQAGNPQVQKGESTWAPGLGSPGFSDSGGLREAAASPQEGGPGGGQAPEIPTTKNTGVGDVAAADNQHERTADAFPETDPPRSDAGADASEGDRRRPRQRRLRLATTAVKRRRRRRDQLPALSDELLAELADVVPQLDVTARRELLDRARQRLRPRPKVLANFAAALRKMALRVRRRDVLATLKPESVVDEKARQSAELAMRAQAAKRTDASSPEAIADFRRLLTLATVPFHLRSADDRARRLHDEGVVVVPLKPRSKEAAITWTEWQQRQMPMSLLRRHLATLGEDAGLAILCGPVSGLCVADLDDESAVAWANKHLPETPWRTKTARGEHWFYRHPATLPADPPPWVGQLQGDGRYVVAPGSQHPDGHRYEALGDWGRPKEDLPVFDQRWLVDVEALRAQRAKILKE